MILRLTIHLKASLKTLPFITPSPSPCLCRNGFVQAGKKEGHQEFLEIHLTDKTAGL